MANRQDSKVVEFIGGSSVISWATASSFSTNIIASGYRGIEGIQYVINTNHSGGKPNYQWNLADIIN